MIERAIRRLPTDVGPDVRAEAEAFLLDSARALDVDDLDKAGKHLYEMIAAEEPNAGSASNWRSRSAGPGRTGR